LQLGTDNLLAQRGAGQEVVKRKPGKAAVCAFLAYRLSVKVQFACCKPCLRLRSVEWFRVLLVCNRTFTSRPIT